MKTNPLKLYRIPRKVVWICTTTSTNDLAKYELLKDPRPWQAFFASEQTKGRGRKGNNWISLKNKGLFLSIVLPDVNKELQNLIPIVTGISVSKAIEDRIKKISNKDINIKLKWPNDIYLNNRKLGGILCETRYHGLINRIICGIGINLTYHPKKIEHINPATDILTETGVVINSGELVNPICNNIWFYLLNLKEKRTDIVTNFLKRDFLYNKYIEVISPVFMDTQNYISKDGIRGIAKGIDKNGALMLESYGIVYRLISGTVSLLKEPKKVLRSSI